MPENRNKFIGTWVSESEKREIERLAKGMGINVSELIRHRVLRPMMTLPEAIDNLKLYIDGRIKKLGETIKSEVKEALKEHLFTMEPIRRTKIEIEEIRPIKKERKIIDVTGISQEQKMLRKEMIMELKELFKKGVKILESAKED